VNRKKRKPDPFIEKRNEEGKPQHYVRERVGAKEGLRNYDILIGLRGREEGKVSEAGREGGGHRPPLPGGRGEQTRGFLGKVHLDRCHTRHPREEGKKG